MISEIVKKQITEAMKARDSLRLSTLKMLSSELHNEEIAKQHELSEEEESVVVKREAKKRHDAIEAYEKAGSTDRADSEKKELVILETYLPEQMDDEALSGIIDEAISETGASQMSDMGRVMSLVMGKTKGQADGGRVSALVKARLLK